MKPPDIFKLGIAGELLAARLTGGGTPQDDSHLLGDLEGHLTSYRDHVAGFESARARADPYNILVEGSDAAINALFAWLVASRINDAPTRALAFDRIDQASSTGPLVF